MNSYKPLSKREKEDLLSELKKQFGVSHIDGVLLKRGAEKIFFFNGDLTMGEIDKLAINTQIERLGVYFAKYQNNTFRLSLEGVWLLKDQITKNIFEVNKEQMNLWMTGQELNLETNKRGFLVIKYKEDFLGCGKASENKISNFIPKSRRLRLKNG